MTEPAPHPCHGGARCCCPICQTARRIYVSIHRIPLARAAEHLKGSRRAAALDRELRSPRFLSRGDVVRAYEASWIRLAQPLRVVDRARDLRYLLERRR